MTQLFGAASPDAVDAGLGDAFSIENLVARLDNDEEIAREVALVFLESTRELLQQLDAAIAEGRVDAVRLNAHSIKGAAANIGADALAETAAVIENAGRDGHLTLAEATSPQLHQRCEHVFSVLDGWC